jgi:ElaB/YqjD/DUF883 family membrane-anchored ribosome-binding protein
MDQVETAANKFSANTSSKSEASTVLSQKRREEILERLRQERAQKIENAKSSISNTKDKRMGIGIKIAIAAILFSVISGGYFYIEALQGKLEAAAEVQQRMEGVITQQKMVMEQTQRDLKRMGELNQEVAAKAQAAQNEVNSLRGKFSRLENIAKAPPSETENRVNRGTKDALRCNEIVTGSPLTADEKSGKVKNNICNDLIQAQLPKKEPAQ